jgi:hypothetical protein
LGDLFWEWCGDVDKIGWVGEHVCCLVGAYG